MYVPVKGGERAIENAHALLADERRGDLSVPEIGVDQIEEQLAIAVDRVMGEGSLYDRRLAAIAIKQACGDLIEAAFLVRAFRTTLSRFGASVPLDTGAMHARRRVSATYKDLPGGQMLGPTFDYTHRLIDFSLDCDATSAPGCTTSQGDDDTATETAHDARDESHRGENLTPHVLSILDQEGLMEPPDGMEHTSEDDEATVGDITRHPMAFPVDRDVRLQRMSRGDEGFLLALGYSTQRGYGRNHPFAGEIRMGEVKVGFVPEELGFEIEIAEITVTECEMVNQFQGAGDMPARFTRGYGLVFGHCERKAMSMALVDRALRSDDLGEPVTAPAQDQEFALSHMDSVEATGFVEHLKLPHYVDFQAELDLIRQLRRPASPTTTDAPDGDDATGEG